jgi:all-trans-retinol 13,14-reductase
MTKLKGLLLAGQSVLLPGVLGAMVSAMVACSLLVGLDPLRKELRQCSDSASS